MASDLFKTEGNPFLASALGKSAAKSVGHDSERRPSKKSRAGPVPSVAAAAAAAAAAVGRNRTTHVRPPPKKAAGRAVQAVEAAEASGPEPEGNAAGGPRKTKASTKRKRAAAAAEARPVADAAHAADALRRTIFVGNVPLATTRAQARRPPPAWPGVESLCVALCVLSRSPPSRQLKALFGAVGKVRTARLRSVPLDGESRLPRRGAVITGATAAGRDSAHAYVEFESLESVTAALALNMSQFGGKHLRVDRASAPAASSLPRAPTSAAAAAAAGAAPPGGALYDKRRSVFVGGLPFDAEDEDVITFFGAIPADALAVTGPGSGPGLEAVRVVRDRKSGVGKGIAFCLFVTPGAARAALSLHGASLKGRPVRISRVHDPIPPPTAGKGGAEGRPSPRARPDAPPRPRHDGATTAHHGAPKRKRADWEGVKARPGGVAPGGRDRGIAKDTSTRRLGGKTKPAVGGESTAVVTRGGAPRAAKKRPAVLARKAAALADAVSPGITPKGMGVGVGVVTGRVKGPAAAGVAKKKEKETRRGGAVRGRMGGGRAFDKGRARAQKRGGKR